MLKRGLAGLAVAFAMWVGPASADIVQFDAAGLFYEVTGPAGWYGAPLPSCGSGAPCVDHLGARDHVNFNGGPAELYPTFALNFTIDTNRGDLTQGPSLATFDWTAADGASPLLSGALSVAGSVLDLGAATSISLSNLTNAFSSGYVLNLAGPEFAVAITNFWDPSPPNLTQNQTRTGFSLGQSSSVSTGPYDLNFTNTQSFAITNLGPSAAAVPEPTSWALMILGLGGLGAVLRRRRQQMLLLRTAATA
jgi:hypothetical protein